MLEFKKKEKKDIFFSENTGKILSISGLIIILITSILFLSKGSWQYSTKLDESIIASYGDFIGGFIGSLFSLAGVILFYVALKEQRNDISINQKNIELQTSALEQQVLEFQNQKVELEETRKVYIEQTNLLREQTFLYRQQNKEIKEQSTTARVQQFDTSFFSYLEVFNNYKKSLNGTDSKDNFFGKIIKEMREINSSESSLNKLLDNICEKYLELLNEYRDILSPYFKTLYRIMVLIDSSSIDEYKKEEYFKLLRSQLSDEELLVLNYNYHTDLGSKVRSFIVKYNFLKHLNLLDKIEFNYGLSQSIKYKFENFLKFTESIIIEGFKDFKNIEYEYDVERSYLKQILELNVEVKLKIVDEFYFSITFLKVDIKNTTFLSDEFIKDIIKRHLFTVLYLSKYVKPNESELEISSISTENKIEYLFKIYNIENL